MKKLDNSSNVYTEREIDILTIFFPLWGNDVFPLNHTIANLKRRNDPMENIQSWDIYCLEDQAIIELLIVHPMSPRDSIFLNLYPSDNYQPHIVFDIDSRHRNWIIKSKKAVDLPKLFNETKSVQKMVWQVDSDNGEHILTALVEFRYSMRFAKVESLFENCHISGLCIPYNTIINLLARNTYREWGPFVLDIKHGPSNATAENIKAMAEDIVQGELEEKIESKEERTNYNTLKLFIEKELVDILAEFKAKKIKHVYDRLVSLKDYLSQQE